MFDTPSDLRFIGKIWSLFSGKLYYMGSGLELVTRVDKMVCCITYYSLKGDFKYFETKELDLGSRKFVSGLHRHVVKCVLEYWRMRLCRVGVFVSSLNRWITRLQRFSMVSAMAMYFYGLTNERPLFLTLSLLPVLLIILFYFLKKSLFNTFL